MEELSLPAKFLVDIDPKTYTNSSEIKLVVVGDKKVGRSRLMATIFKGSVLSSDEWDLLVSKLEREGSVHRTFIKTIKPDQNLTTGIGTGTGTPPPPTQELTLSFWDTPSTERIRYRPLAYTQADIIIILVDLQHLSTLTYPEIYVPDDILDGSSEKNIEEKTLLEEIDYHCPGVPFLLVGNKIDVEEGSREVTKQDGKATAAKIGARQYLEISTVTGEGIVELMSVCTRLGYNHKMETDPVGLMTVTTTEPEITKKKPKTKSKGQGGDSGPPPSCCCLL